MAATDTLEKRISEKKQLKRRKKLDKLQHDLPKRRKRDSRRGAG